MRVSVQKMRLQAYRFLFCAVLAACTACANRANSSLVIADHAFAFDTRIDSPNEEILAYRYGQGIAVGTSSDNSIRQFGHAPSFDGVRGAIPVGDKLYVKWRNKLTQEVFEDTVDLRSRLPKNMEDQRVYFVVNDKQLFVYLTDLKTLRPADSPIVGRFKTQLYLTRQIYPNQ